MMSDVAAADWTSVDDFKGVWSFLEKEKPSTKFDLLACVCSFAVEKRVQMSQKSKGIDDDYPLSSRYVLNWYTPKKKRSKRPRYPGRRSESDLNPHPPLKKLKVSEAVTALPDLGVNKVYPVHCTIDFSPKGDTFVPAIVQTLDHKVPNMSVTVKKKNNTMEIPVVGLREQIEKMNGTNILLLGEKALTNSDVNSSLSRLMMPESQMVNSWKFLTDEENAFLKIKNGNHWNGLRVCLLQPPTYSSSSSSSVTLRRWEMMKEYGNPSTISCVLASGWNQVVWRNQLKSGTIVQVWSFRVGKDLHLALVVI